ncbi:hypothetical protein HUO14_06000 [Parasphingorhabdus flavimaris]|jgi:hypothetical protein|uniref:Antitoxin n=1 Tax=Parasphingorhabdus flavimaris TaxID=266812 RepID=A0ABX2N160_9SPHN|nr:hypothetical protein [Parasphingorhabdus flavimaris]NVD27455.1 hypothetical protein [Parasphingorhabdus flavimaris]|tara:strand:- start:15740 stop:15919 length:180 start_codon:yes stop_codon:yes gene_type:complete
MMNQEPKAEAAKVAITGEKPDAGYEDWFRTKVKKSIDDTDKGAKIYPAEEVWNALGLDD